MDVEIAPSRSLTRHLRGVIQRESGVRLRGDLLSRIRATEQLVGLSRAQRASNAQGAFEVSPDRHRRWPDAA